MDLPEETPVPQNASSPLAMGPHAHTPPQQLAIPEVELVKFVVVCVPLGISHIHEGLSMVAKLLAQDITETMPRVTFVEPRRSIRLKVKGTHNSID
jgi:hypothetical protein